MQVCISILLQQTTIKDIFGSFQLDAANRAHTTLKMFRGNSGPKLKNPDKWNSKVKQNVVRDSGVTVDFEVSCEKYLVGIFRQNLRTC